MSSWSPDSWKSCPVQQCVKWPDRSEFKSVLAELRRMPPLVFAGEMHNLKSQLKQAAQGKSFLIQGGDCAETFGKFDATNIQAKFKFLLQMSAIISFGATIPVVKLGRFAGQFAKPRSQLSETRDGISLPAYRGDAVNSVEFTPEARRPDPQRMLRAYHQSASSLNLLRAFIAGGYSDIHKAHLWNQAVFNRKDIDQKYRDVIQRIDKAVKFAEASGFTLDQEKSQRLQELFTSHEALLLNFEEALTVHDEESDQWFDGSAHMLWVGERTRQLDGGHIEFLSGIQNPVAVKLGPNVKSSHLLRLCDKLNPLNEYGRMTLITRFGADYIESVLPSLIRAVERDGRRVLWVSDPMHGNTYLSKHGHKTRRFEVILDELKKFFLIHRSEGSIPGGVHFELTEENVTECVGGSRNLEETDLFLDYQTACDPRLNNEQSLEMAFLVSNLLRN